jgi:hypothetical protein
MGGATGDIMMQAFNEVTNGVEVWINEIETFLVLH